MENSDFYENIYSSVKALDFDKEAGRFAKIETLQHAFWIMLRKNGYTNEMLDEALAEALEIEAQGTKALKGMNCPNCGRNAQLSGAFKIKCIYCGTESIINPYEAHEIATEMDAAMAQQQEDEAQKERWNQAVQNDPFKPYDVSKDLNFDDYDSFDDNNRM